MSASNIYPSESELDGSTTVNFPIPVRYLAITNKSGSAVLKWKFKASQAFSELKPTEIITIEDINVHTVLLESSNGSYRIMGRG